VFSRILPFRRRKTDGRIGFIYVPDGETGPMSRAQQGVVVRVEGRGPPWIVVDEVQESIVLTKWPGTLWKARIVEAATAEDQRSRGGPPLPYARYTRCISVEILGKEDPSALFGEHGQEVLAVLERARLLTRDQALALSSARHHEASDAYDRAFRCWAEAEHISVEAHDDNLDGTLMIGSMPAKSPINNGLSLIYQTVFDRAKAVEGSSATHVDEWGDVELVEPWSGAGTVLLDAALGRGAPDFVEERDRHILTMGFLRVFSAT
jgi:hypothetical protein